jgi:ribonuclease P/MRP protein subunit POP5
MTPRPPTLREKRRYILVRTDPAGIVPDAKELYYAVNDAVASLWGDAAAARVHAAVVSTEGEFAVMRCRRGAERELAIALTTVTSCSGERIALRTLATSGTIENLRGLIGSLQENIPATPLQPEEYTIYGRTVVVSHCSGQKVDVIEKGFKNATRFFLTTEDLEDI